ncbi:hypothetical protein QFZ28_003291 [Neobacillus niacini]|nr:hypothetical protein [Neobacillus niacini]
MAKALGIKNPIYYDKEEHSEWDTAISQPTNFTAFDFDPN